MGQVSPWELSPFADADDLIQALGRLRKHDHKALADEVASLANHPDGGVRAEAIRLLLVVWRISEFHGLATSALVEDPDSEVQIHAAYGLAATSSDATRTSDLVLLLRILRDPEREWDVRGSAYDGLLILDQRPEFPMMRAFDPSSDVDWSWIAELEKREGLGGGGA